MKRVATICYALIFVMAGGILSNFAIAQPKLPATLPLLAFDGSTIKLSDVVHQNKLTAVVFISTSCPISNRFVPELNEITGRYRAEGVSVVGVYMDLGISLKEAAAHHREYDLQYTTLLDPSHLLLRYFPASVTPEVFLVDSSGNILYQGRINDRYSSPGRDRVTPHHHDLDEAIKLSLAGKKLVQKSTKAIGCFIENVER